MLTPDLNASKHQPFSKPSAKSHNKYPQLLNGSQTRVVHIQPGSQSAKFAGCFEVIDLDLESRSSYDAISYHCGALTPVSQFYLADIDIYLPIARNLTDAVSRVVNDGIPGPFWIDAICIDQIDIEERNQQVQLMTRIFESAQRVLIWLGPDDGTLLNVLGLVRKWADPYNDLATSMEIFFQGVNNPHLFKAADYVGQLAKEMTREEWAILSAFFDRSYFKRAWIVQEVSVGRELQVLCGGFPSFGF